MHKTNEQNGNEDKLATEVGADTRQKKGGKTDQHTDIKQEVSYKNPMTHSVSSAPTAVQWCSQIHVKHSK